jgi:hypothetical protein
MKLHHFAMLALGITAWAGWAQAEETTRVYRQGNSSATITQSGGGSSSVIRRTIDGPDSQTIMQRQGGGRAVVRQSVDEDEAGDPEGDAVSEAAGSVGRVQVVVSLSAAEQEDLRELALEEETSVQALVEAAIQDLLDGAR